MLSGRDKLYLPEITLM